jgi:rhodopsin domain-containing protein
MESSPAQTPHTLPPKSDTILPEVVTVNTVLYSLALLTFILRIFSRIRPYNLCSDDWAMAAAMCLTTVNWSLAISIQAITGGVHTMYVPIAVISKAAKLAFAYAAIWIWTVTAIKISVALMLLRIKQDRRWRTSIWTLIGILLASGIASTIPSLLQCRPIQANWNVLLHVQPGKCWSVSVETSVSYSITGM